MKVFITGVGNISPQRTFDNNHFLDEIEIYTGNRLTCAEPDYEKLINSRVFRRMSRILRMSWTAAKICLDDAGVQVPDAIVTGTGMGCIEDTEKFLMSIYESNERLLPPTPFIQSTHNTIGSQIALLLECTNYNMTFTQRGSSFENALLDGISLLHEPGYYHVLAGGFDEMTTNQVILYNRLKYYKKEITSNLDLLKGKTQGTIAGEGNAFFMLSQVPGEKCYAAISDVEVFHHPKNLSAVMDWVGKFLTKNSLNSSGIQLFIAGLNGDAEGDKIYYEVTNRYFNKATVGYFKHLCGEYHTASAYALWLGANVLKRQFLPDVSTLKKSDSQAFKNALIYNHYRNSAHSLILLTAC